MFCLCRIAIANITWLDHIFRKLMTAFVFIANCDITTWYCIFCIDVSYALRVSCELTCRITYDWLERVTRDMFCLCRIAIANITWLDHIFRKLMTAFIFIADCDISAWYCIFRIDVSHALRVSCELTCRITYDWLERVTWDMFYLCRIAITNITWLDHVFGKFMTVFVFIANCDISTWYCIFRIDVSHALRVSCEVTCRITYDWLERMTWDMFCLCRIAIANITWLDHIFGKLMTVFVFIANCDISAWYCIFRIDICHALRVSCEVTCRITYDGFKGVTRDMFCLCRIAITNITWLDNVFRKLMTIFIFIADCDITTWYCIFRIDVSHALRISCELTCRISYDGFKGMTWDMFCLCRIAIANITWLDHVFGKLMTAFIFITDCDITTWYCIFCIDILQFHILYANSNSLLINMRNKGIKRFYMRSSHCFFYGNTLQATINCCKHFWFSKIKLVTINGFCDWKIEGTSNLRRDSFRR